MFRGINASPRERARRLIEKKNEKMKKNVSLVWAISRRNVVIGKYLRRKARHPRTPRPGWRVPILPLLFRLSGYPRTTERQQHHKWQAPGRATPPVSANTARARGTTTAADALGRDFCFPKRLKRLAPNRVRVLPSAARCKYRAHFWRRPPAAQ